MLVRRANRSSGGSVCCSDLCLSSQVLALLPDCLSYFSAPSSRAPASRCQLGHATLPFPTSATGLLSLWPGPRFRCRGSLCREGLRSQAPTPILVVRSPPFLRFVFPLCVHLLISLPLVFCAEVPFPRELEKFVPHIRVSVATTTMPDTVQQPPKTYRGVSAFGRLLLGRRLCRRRIFGLKDLPVKLR